MHDIGRVNQYTIKNRNEDQQAVYICTEVAVKLYVQVEEYIVIWTYCESSATNFFFFSHHHLHLGVSPYLWVGNREIFDWGSPLLTSPTGSINSFTTCSPIEQKLGVSINFFLISVSIYIYIYIRLYHGIGASMH